MFFVVAAIAPFILRHTATKLVAMTALINANLWNVVVVYVVNKYYCLQRKNQVIISSNQSKMLAHDLEVSTSTIAITEIRRKNCIVYWLLLFQLTLWSQYAYGTINSSACIPNEKEIIATTMKQCNDHNR